MLLKVETMIFQILSLNNSLNKKGDISAKTSPSHLIYEIVF